MPGRVGLDDPVAVDEQARERERLAARGVADSSSGHDPG